MSLTLSGDLNDGDIVKNGADEYAVSASSSVITGLDPATCYDLEILDSSDNTRDIITACTSKNIK